MSNEEKAKKAAYEFIIERWLEFIKEAIKQGIDEDFAVSEELDNIIIDLLEDNYRVFSS